MNRIENNEKNELFIISKDLDFQEFKIKVSNEKFNNVLLNEWLELKPKVKIKFYSDLEQSLDDIQKIFINEIDSLSKNISELEKSKNFQDTQFL